MVQHFSPDDYTLQHLKSRRSVRVDVYLHCDQSRPRFSSQAETKESNKAPVHAGDYSRRIRRQIVAVSGD